MGSASGVGSTAGSADFMGAVEGGGAMEGRGASASLVADSLGGASSGVVGCAGSVSPISERTRSFNPPKAPVA
ncbi:hypothetical protein [Methylocystis sp. SB2]|uniref:hypothetical protein n=1 Tax=Methylocystis sp. (strain SB2) TaxID=743836 RepID=UPI001EFA4EDA|nr:hypothetical protein [Methylocystis sp. SB2]ULO22521.1 hypothetical protein LNB28_09980 [Methylocystis sp. SB2]